MRRQGIVWLGATIAILGTAACFSDPTSSVRSGPSRLQVTYDNGNIGTLTTAYIPVGATEKLRIQVLDKQGNYFPFTAPTVGTASTGVATLVTFPDSANYTAPGNPYWKANLVGVAAGTTTATFTAGGVTDTLKVIVQ